MKSDLWETVYKWFKRYLGFNTSELEHNANAHMELAQDLKLKLLGPLQEFTNQQSATRKNHSKVVEKIQQQRNLSQQAVFDYL